MSRLSLTFFALLLTHFLAAQMPDASGRVLVGDEWIDYDARHLQIEVAEDGIYRLDAADLATAGFALNAANAERWVLWRNGNEVPLRVDDDGLLFVGLRNRDELDRHLYTDPDGMLLNTDYSLYTDTASYFLTLRDGGGPRYQTPTVSAAQPRTEVLRHSTVTMGNRFSKNYFRSARSTIQYSIYDIAEGFGQFTDGQLITINDIPTSFDYTLPLPGANGGEATLELRFGLAFNNHLLDISVDGNVLRTVESSGWSVQQQRLNFTPGGNSALLNLHGRASDNDRANFATATVTYPAGLAYDDAFASFQLPDNSGPSSLTFTDLGADAGAVVVLNPTLSVATTATAVGGSADVELPAVSQSSRFWLARDADLKRPARLKGRTFRPLLPTGGRVNYLIITSEELNGPNLDAYESYRESAAGGGYTVNVVNVEDLYDTYGYGVRRHPMSIRNYLTDALAKNADLQYLLIVGKGQEYHNLRSVAGLELRGDRLFVPTFGFPASDVLLVSPLGEVIPRVAVGRIPVINDAETGIYLDKLRRVEAQINAGDQDFADRDWMKQVMHLGGGVTPAEQSSIRNRLRTIERTIENSRMGANVTSFFKTSSEPIEDSRSAAIFDRINQGTAIVTFFGHSSAQGFDFSIDNPDNYDNTGRYPYMISLGCYSGNTFVATRSIAERFLFLQDGGAIAFSASRGVGYISALGNWSDVLYDQMGNELYGQGIGDAIKETIRAFSGTSNFTQAILTEQFGLFGDPAYRMHPRPGPDVVIDPANVRFTPEVIPATFETYEATVRVVNLGTGAGPDSIDLRFRQELPDGETRELYTHRMAVPFYESYEKVRLPNLGFEAVGINRLFVTVDAGGELAESPLPAAENNNALNVGGRAGVPLIVIANTARAAWPPDYAVVSGDLELVANTTDPTSAERRYELQVALTEDFAQPLVNESFVAPGGVIRYKPAINYRDSTTYYWRISPDSSTTEGAGYLWSNSSYTWLADRPDERIGWAMQHPGQTNDGTYRNIRENDRVPGTWQFAKTVTDILVANGRYQDNQMPRVEFNGQRFNSRFRWLYLGGINVWVIDTISSSKWLNNPGGLFGTRNRETTSWQFSTLNPENRRLMMEFLTDYVPDGQYVIVYTADRGDDYYNDSWLQDSAQFGRSLFSVLEAEGAEQVRIIGDRGNVPYVFAYQKGKGRIAEGIAMTRDDQITVDVPIITNWNEGSWTSEKAGPALDWNYVDVQLTPTNLSTEDSVRFELFGIRNDGVGAILHEVNLLVPDETSLRFDLTDVNANLYPRMEVRLKFFDDLERTSPTVKQVYFDYTRPGDVAVSPAIAYELTDSLQQGQDFALELGYENLSPTPMDSLLVELRLQTSDNQVVAMSQRRPPLEGKGSGQVRFDLPTDEISGSVQVQLRLNPGQDQIEDVTFNNDLIKRTGISRDVIAPVLQVFFDGRRINDGELVSSRPEIMIQIRDENEQLLLNDTTGYLLELTPPSGGRPERIRFTDERVEFIPATDQENVAEIFFRPELLEDGEYELAVRGADRSENLAGRIDFRQTFEVVNAQLVSNVLAYPNPFTTQTQFVYTLTGNEPPTVFRIQIMTVSGRVVRDIDLTQTEDLSIGTHRTEFTWDGTDEYGDLLANGVYLYRVITSDGSGNQLEKYDTGTDQFFENEMGKVVILR